MGRVLGLPFILLALAVGGYVFYQHSKSDSGPTAPQITQMETQASVAVATTNFQAAGEVLQGWFAQNGTYAGATVPPGSGVILVKADDAGYCLQSADGATDEHEYGPDGQVQPGPC